MNDATLTLLLDNIVDTANNDNQQLFVADENIADIGALIQIASRMPVITNRYHLFTAIQSTGHPHHFSDFDFSFIEDATLQRLYYRTSKEKPVVHHVINAAARLLKTGGTLVIAGEKQQGIQTYTKKAEQRLGSMAVVKKDGPARIGIIPKKIPGETLPDNEYTLLRPAITADDMVFYSKPGVFGWDKIDQGSAFLATHLDKLPIKNARLLDLGCGYGYLSVMAHPYTPSITHATDNNAAALLACKKNFEQHNITGEVFADDIGAKLTPGYDVILCNPPFHQGFDIEHTLAEQFIAASARLLGKRGQALFVVNSFIALEKVASRYFNKIDVLADNKRFKLVLLAGCKNH
jgi:16S rRNA (guanine1207-N2)-methyltransferase